MTIKEALNKFKSDESFYNNLQELFKSLSINLNSVTQDKINIKDILIRNYKENSEAFKLINSCYFLGLIDDSALTDNQDKDIETLKDIKADYEGIVIFGIKLNPRDNGLLPTRSQLAEISRAFNREFCYTPVVIIFQYDNYLSIANTERLSYKQEWREGEKAGKISLLRDISTDKPHTGHIKILEDMKLNKDINSFKKLYEHWQKVFNISTLNNNFYRELSNWYFWAMDIVKYPADVPVNDITEHKAKNLIRLLTRLLFVWFVKEKKLIPEELFIKDKVSEFLDLNNESAYYKAILQNLFFAVLNTEMGKREFRNEGQHKGIYTLLRYKRFFTDTTEFLKLIQDIPFMNGGLFECLDHPDPEKKGIKGGEITISIDGFSDLDKNPIFLPNFIFWGGKDNVNLNKVFGDKSHSNLKVRGLLDILNSYKFTIEENTPVEEDIALDPELLGRVFENLLASYNPETKTTARKQTGSFYTPREIVNYMVDESLIAYLKNHLDDNEENDKKLRQLLSYNYETHSFEDNADIDKIIKALDNCKILDPACGSGAFPMGILQKMVYILSKIDPNNEKWKNTQIKKAETIDDYSLREKAVQDIEDAFLNNELDYGRKLYLIEYCIFGVDIQPIAIQISKLRFFISLIVDQKINIDKENQGITPLPNLEAKFVAANTLISLEKPKQLTFMDLETKPIEEEINAIRHKIFTCKTPQTKKAYREKEKQKREELAKCLIDIGFNSNIADKIAKWDPYNQNDFADFFEPEYMFGLNDGFDIVIGNPPYVQLQKFKGHSIQKLLKDQNYKIYDSMGDIYCLFYEKGLVLLKEAGFLCYITSNKWMRAGYGEKLREYFTKHNPSVLIDLGPGVFDSATVDTNILLIQKAINQKNLIALTYYSQLISLEQAVQTDFTILKNLSKDAWFIGSNAEISLKEKIEKIGKPLKEWDVNINYGIKTGLNDAFIIDTRTKERICNEDPKSAEIIKPILRGRDIKRYGYKWAGLWIIATFPVLHIDIDKYPAVKKHLLDFGKDRLEQAGKTLPDGTKSRKKTGNKWFETQDQIGYYKEFEKEKIVWGNIAYNNTFSYLDKGVYLNAPGNLITSQTVNLKYLFACLNSKIFYFEFQKIGIFLGKAYEWKKQYIEQIHIPIYTPSNQHIVTQIESLVDEILSIKKDNLDVDTTSQEREIDLLVYKLYDLTDDEIGLIEQSCSQT
jgi:tRNA1(Val) A37 N6-methylase TrmN6